MSKQKNQINITINSKNSTPSQFSGTHDASIPEDLNACAKTLTQVKLAIDDLNDYKKALREQIDTIVDKNGNAETTDFVIKKRTHKRRSANLGKIMQDNSINAENYINTNYYTTLNVVPK